MSTFPGKGVRGGVRAVRSRLMRAGVVAGALAVAACGGSSGSDAPSPVTPVPPADDGLTATITSSGVSPRTFTVRPGSQITFVNHDSTTHLMFSDPHPEHTDCPEINQVGVLDPGQVRQTGNLNTVRSCRFHDHNQPSNTSLQGTITIR